MDTREDTEKGENMKEIRRRTQVFKENMISFFDNSTDIINEISKKLESALSHSRSSNSTLDTSTNQLTTPSSRTDSEYGPAMPAVSRKLNSLPEFGMTLEDREAMSKHRKRTLEAACNIRQAEKTETDNNLGACHILTEESEKDSLAFESGFDDSLQCLDRNMGSHKLVATGPDPYDKFKVHEISSSGWASDLDGYGPSTSIDSSERKQWIASGSEGSVQSWASSLSLDSQSDEATVEFMRQFVSHIFKDSGDIPLHLKAKFGELCQVETGRLWFSRFVNVQRGKCRRVTEGTFYSLVQHFAIVLFECADADDFSPAKSLMNMCFTFYLEVDVPGCEPYKEYLYIYLKDQSIWHTTRFWNAAFFDALQCERVHQPVATRDDRSDDFADDKHYQENITFGQLGKNAHAFCETAQKVYQNIELATGRNNFSLDFYIQHACFWPQSQVVYDISEETVYYCKLK